MTMELMFQPLKRYVDFNGRARRTEYWLWFLFQIIASLVFSVLKSVIGDTAEVLNGIFSLAILLPSLAVGVRRFHDINRTGWWIVFPGVVLLVAMVVFFSVSGSAFFASMQSFSNIGPNPTPDQVMSIMSSLAPMGWVFLLWFAAALVTFVFNVMDGTPGPNRFGPDPKGRGSDTNIF
jgi:uncharacterized membrane protein YhaH (DUF805 family)